ncbi:MAG TPA: hypothetical protein VNE42_04760 [Acidimicrobiales bacterium]|nr:hypothetical protein [Acidimicrobiales bacterium]
MPENANIVAAHELLKTASTLNPEIVRVHDASSFQRDDCIKLYRDEFATSAVAWDYRISKLFGSHKYHGSNSGRYVPALVIRFTGDAIQVVGPHEQWRRVSGDTRYELHTVFDVLHLLNTTEKTRIFES